MLTVTRQQAREADHHAIQRICLPGVVLMENAARNAVDVACEMLARQREQRDPCASVAVLAGAGNNGGDGYAMARHLHLRGHQVMIYALRHPDLLTGDASINAQVAIRMELPLRVADTLARVRACRAQWQRMDMLIDAMLGTGFEGGPLREPYATAIRLCNEVHKNHCSVLAVDVPSGLDADTGQAVADAAVEADATVTFIAMKKGFLAEGASRHTGQVHVRDIGLPVELLLD